jgi:CheY-like chemotaxis protein
MPATSPESPRSIVMPLHEPALVAFDGDRIRSVNTRAATIFGAAPEQLAGAPADAWLDGVRGSDGRTLAPAETSGRRADGSRFRCRLQQRADGNWLLRYLPDAHEILDLFHGQRAIVEGIVRGDSLREVLTALAKLAERHSPGGMRCSILVLDEAEGVLRTMGQPSLPEEFVAAIDRLVPAPQRASCGHAAAVGEQVLTTAIADDPWWRDFAGFMASHGIQASWSSPILSPRNGKVLGTFGMYYPAPRHPTPFELHLIESFTHLAALAIDRHHSDMVRAAHGELLQTAALRDQFFSAIAHDLRSPLQSIVLGLDQLEVLRPEPAPAVRDALAVVRQAAAYLIDVADDATQLARPMADVHLHTAPHDLAELAGAAATVVQAQAATAGVRIEVAAAAPPPRVAADGARLRRCIVNLLTNAIGHAPRGSTIRVDVTDDVGAGRATVAVSDQGPGLPAGREYLVFEPFVQLGSPGERPAGVGLGLAIVKRFVEAHGGVVGVRSTPGQGARFWFDLPSLPPAAASSSDPKNRPTPATVTPTAGATNAAPAAAPAAATGGGIAGVRILIADDEDLLRSTMVRHLGRLGAVVAEARDGREALARLRTERHDVLLLDANMPQCNGAAVLADLRREPLAHRPLVVLLSGGDLCDADGTRFEDLGADLVVQKPVRISALATAIAQALAARGR